MFIGRKTELESLSSAFATSRASISVVFGRRRVGKSSLIERAGRGTKFFAFEGLENQPQSAQKKIFIEQLRAQGCAVSSARNQSWYELLSNLRLLINPTEVTVILLDELQWLANYRSELISALKLVWDQILSKHSNLKLVLCGSVASFMVRKVIRSRALYGRCDLTLNLQPFKLAEAKEMLPGKLHEETLLAYLLVGGIPKYLSLLTDKDSVLRSLAFHCQGINAYFSSEYQRIFLSHFGDNPHYEKVARFLCGKSYGANRSEIVENLSLPNSGQLTEILENLEYAGVIHSFVPFTEKSSSRTKRFHLVDNFIRFYLTFLEPLVLGGALERTDFLSQVFNTPKMSSWLGISFELTCLNHISEIAQVLGFAAVRYQAGPYFRHGSTSEGDGAQLDLVYKRGDMVCTVCEVKYQNGPIGISVAKRLDEAISKVKELKNKTVQKVLIGKDPTSNKLEDGVNFSRVLSIDEIM